MSVSHSKLRYRTAANLVATRPARFAVGDRVRLKNVPEHVKARAIERNGPRPPTIWTVRSAELRLDHKADPAQVVWTYRIVAKRDDDTEFDSLVPQWQLMLVESAAAA